MQLVLLHLCHQWQAIPFFLGHSGLCSAAEIGCKWTLETPERDGTWKPGDGLSLAILEAYSLDFNVLMLPLFSAFFL